MTTIFSLFESSDIKLSKYIKIIVIAHDFAISHGHQIMSIFFDVMMIMLVTANKNMKFLYIFIFCRYDP